MAAFLTPEQIRKIRIKGSTVMKFASLDDKELRVVKMSSGAQLESQSIQKDVAEKKLRQKDFLIFMIKNSCAQMDGELFTDEDAEGVFDILPVDDVILIVNEAARLIASSVKVRANKTGETVIVEGEVTEAEKK